jgi:hypothetical protein
MTSNAVVLDFVIGAMMAQETIRTFGGSIEWDLGICQEMVTGIPHFRVLRKKIARTDFLFIKILLLQ